MEAPQEQEQQQNREAQTNTSLQALTQVVTKAALEAMTTKLQEWGEATATQLTANTKEMIRDSMQDVGVQYQMTIFHTCTRILRDIFCDPPTH